MVYFATDGKNTPASRSQGPIQYRNPYFTSSCGCGSGQPSVQMLPAQGPAREGLEVMPAGSCSLAAAQPPMCTLTATAPPAGCCNPSPLHCDCCNGAGYFRASEAYGS